MPNPKKFSPLQLFAKFLSMPLPIGKKSKKNQKTPKIQVLVLNHHHVQAPHACVLCLPRIGTIGAGMPHQLPNLCCLCCTCSWCGCCDQLGLCHARSCGSCVQRESL